MDPVLTPTTSGAIAGLIELSTANIDNPTELNAVGTAIEDLRLVHESVAASDRATLYRLDTSSDTVSAPYIMASATAGLRWVAICGYACNQAVNLAGGVKMRDPTDHTKIVTWDLTGQTTAITLTLKPTSSTSQTLQYPNITATDTIAALGLAQSFTALNTFSAGITSKTPITFQDATDATKQWSLSLSGMTTAKTLTLASAQTTSQTLNFPNITGADTLASLGLAQTFSAVNTFSSATAANAGATTGAIVISAGGAAVFGAVQSQLGFGFGELPVATANIFTAIATVNGATYYRMRNLSNGTGASADFRSFNDTGDFIQFGINSSGKTTYGAMLAGMAYNYSAGAAGSIFMTDNASAPIIFASGGNAATARFSSAKNLLIGTTSDTGLTGSGGLIVASGTDATSPTAAANITTGGASVGKTLIHAKGRGAGFATNATVAGTITLSATSAEIQTFTGSTAGTVVQFPAANLRGAGISVLFTINNQSTQTVTPTRAGADTFQGGGTTDPVVTGATTRYASDGVSVWMKI